MALAHLWVLVWPVNAVQEKQLRVKITTTTITNEIQRYHVKNIPQQLGDLSGLPRAHSLAKVSAADYGVSNMSLKNYYRIKSI